MALRKVLHLPNPRLRLVAKPVMEITQDIQLLIDDMFETMYAENGVGLAATQIDVQLRVVTIDVSENRQTPLCLINPELLTAEGKVEAPEACLSVPGAYDKVTRAAKVHVHFLDRQGSSHKIIAEGLLAKCIQHEIDHLNGKLFIDHLSLLKRQRILKKLEKIHHNKY